MGSLLSPVAAGWKTPTMTAVLTNNSCTTSYLPQYSTECDDIRCCITLTNLTNVYALAVVVSNGILRLYKRKDFKDEGLVGGMHVGLTSPLRLQRSNGKFRWDSPSPKQGQTKLFYQN